MVDFATPAEELLRRAEAERDAFKDLAEGLALCLAVARFGHIDAAIGHRVVARGYTFSIERSEAGEVTAQIVPEPEKEAA